ncbi:uncharacterized [Tachysurus ichikawai]
MTNYSMVPLVIEVQQSSLHWNNRPFHQPKRPASFFTSKPHAQRSRVLALCLGHLTRKQTATSFEEMSAYGNELPGAVSLTPLYTEQLLNQRTSAPYQASSL